MATKNKKPFTCCGCGETLDLESDFYASSSNLYASIGRIPVCKKCLHNNYKIWSVQYKSKKVAMKRFCMAFDVYYSDDILDSVLNSKDNKKPILSQYIVKMNLNQNRDKTFDTSIEDGTTFNIDENQEKSSVPEAVKARWGVGLSDDNYRNLDQHYKYLKKNNPTCDSNQEIFIQDLCFLHMQKMESIKAGDKKSCIDLMTAYRNTFDKAGLKTVESIDDDACLGKFVNLIGSYTPEYIYKDKELYKDSDLIDEYIERHMVRPFNNIINKTNIRDEEFCINDTDESSVVDE